MNVIVLVSGYSILLLLLPKLLLMRRTLHPLARMKSSQSVITRPSGTAVYPHLYRWALAQTGRTARDSHCTQIAQAGQTLASESPSSVSCRSSSVQSISSCACDAYRGPLSFPRRSSEPFLLEEGAVRSERAATRMLLSLMLLP